MTQHSTVAPAPTGTEPFRPRAHFTPRRNWINDPNGLVHFEGEYHLFYQYNPHGMDWGHMSWGHAVSTDLAHWQELPVAIPETDRMIFSGSIVVDWHDISGLGDGSAPPLLAYYTAFDPVTSIQSQHLAYSHDRGRSFTHYAGNPIIDLNHADFRDPKVFHHAESNAWIMAVALAKDHVVQFYRSTNLLDWTLAGSFGPAGSTAGQWECPDLMPVPIEGEGDATAWVLKVDVDTGFLDGGSGTQYFVGDFDGSTFVVDPAHGDPAGDRVDHGPDFYAAISWSELPGEQPGPVWIGWQSNHQSGRFYPTDPWRGAMSLPRRLFLWRDGDRLRLGQEPVLPDPEPATTTGGAAGARLTGDAVPIVPAMGSGQCTFDLVGGGGGCASIEIVDGTDRLLVVAFDRDAGHVVFERPASPAVATPEFRRRTIAATGGDRLGVRIVVDGPLVELFLNGGRLVYTAVVFPGAMLEIVGRATSGDWRIEALSVGILRPTMFV